MPRKCVDVGHMPPSEPLKLDLTPGDRTSALWGKLMDYHRKKLAQLRQRNDHVMTEDKRNKLLGQIAETKAFLDLNEKPFV